MPRSVKCIFRREFKKCRIVVGDRFVGRHERRSCGSEEFRIFKTRKAIIFMVAFLSRCSEDRDRTYVRRGGYELNELEKCSFQFSIFCFIQSLPFPVFSSFSLLIAKGLLVNISIWTTTQGLYLHDQLSLPRELWDLYLSIKLEV